MKLDAEVPASFPRKSAQLSNGHKYEYIDAWPDHTRQSSPVNTVLLLHGFPDSAKVMQQGGQDPRLMPTFSSRYGYRYAIVALVAAGFRCIAPWQLGYWPSSQPDAIEAYGFRSLSSDIDELLTMANVKRKILLVGHDWGGHHAWRFAAYFPHRVEAIAVFCTPYTPPAAAGTVFMDTKTLVDNGLKNFGYQLFFGSDSGSELLYNNLDVFLVTSFAKRRSVPSSTDGDDKDLIQPSESNRPAMEPWSYPGVLEAKYRQFEKMRKAGKIAVHIPSEIEDPELHVYLDSFRRGGIKHPLNYYRNRRVCYDEEIDADLSPQFPASIPALFVTGTNDAALPTSMSDRCGRFFQKNQYTRVILQDATHWLLQDSSHRDKVSAILSAWAWDNSRSARL